MSEIPAKDKMIKETKQMIIFAIVVNAIIFVIDLYKFSANMAVPLLCIASVLCAWPRKQPKPILRRISFTCLGLALILGLLQVVICAAELIYETQTGRRLPLSYIVVLSFFTLLPVYVGLYKRIKTRKRSADKPE